MSAAARWEREVNGLMGASAPVENKTWVFTEGTRLSRHLLGTNVSSCEIDFLDLGIGASNHVIMRLMFQHPKLHATAHNPAGTTGLRLSLDVDPLLSYEDYEPGNFNVQTIRYTGEHLKAAFTMQLALTGSGIKTVGEFLDVVSGQHMLPCDFNWSTDSAVGCRDFNSQLIWKCMDAGILVRNPAISVPFQHHYSKPRGGLPAILPIVPAPVQPALFRDPRFVRSVIPGMPLDPLWS